MTDRNTTTGGLYYDAENRTMSLPKKEVVPTRLVYAMFGLALGALALTTFSVLTDRAHVGRPPAETALSTHTVILAGEGNAAFVTAPDGRVLLDSETGAFVAVVRSGLERARRMHQVAGNPAVEIARYPSGRMTLTDPATGWEMNLSSFGQGNLAHFERMLANDT